MKRRINYYLRQITRNILAVVEGRVAHLEAQQGDLSRQIAEVRRSMRESAPENPSLHGFKVYSQADEDGIIEYLLERLPTADSNRTFIEIGCGDGLENNSHFLLLKGYSGVWLDGSEQNIQFIRDAIDEKASADEGRLLLMSRFVDRQNIAAILESSCKFLGNTDPDFFSLDIDGNDCFIAEEVIKHISPKIICAEYNAKFPPNFRTSIRYDKDHIWKNDDYHGASLAYFCKILQGYSLVSCNMSGANAFFARNDLMSHYATYPVDVLYQPFRSHLRLLRTGHPASLKWLRNALRAGGERSAATAAGAGGLQRPPPDATQPLPQSARNG